MTIRNLDSLFKPKSIALIGASRKPSSVGAVLARNLFMSGFPGPVMPVNPNHQSIEGVLAYPDIKSLPMTPDLAVVCTPPDSVPGIIAELAERGTKGAVIITAGFGEGGGEHGYELRRQVLETARPHLLRVIGPNCLGILVPGSGVNASFCHVNPKKGRLAFVTQSGAIVTSVVDWAEARGIGFSHLISLGDMIDVDFGDLLDYLANDPEVKAILLYIEAVTDARKFMSAARAAARMKPVIVVKSGRHAEGAKAAASHTGALAGADNVYDTIFSRAGMLRVLTLDELFDAVEILDIADAPKGDRLAILTNGGGIGVLATDALIDEGGRLAEISPDTIEKLNKVLPVTWSHGNPIDIIGDATGKRYADALSATLEDKNVDAVLVLNCPTAVASNMECAKAVVEAVKKHKGANVLTSWVGDATALAARDVFQANRIPSYASPEHAVRAFMYMVRYRQSQEILMETPPSVPEEFTPDTAKVKEIIAKVLSEGREWLTEPEAKEVLSAYTIPVVPTRVAPTPRAAAEMAAAMGGEVVVKILSHDITHKSDVGGVALGLAGPGAVLNAAEGMLARIAQVKPEARIDGFAVQPMVHRPGAYETVIGLVDDPQFGPVLLFGHGGTAVEVMDDTALALPPLNMRLAREVMSRTRIYKLLKGYRGLAPVNLDAVALTLIKVAQLATDIGEISELDINPLLVDEYGVMGLDARVRVKKNDRPAAERLAIRPYPKDLEEEVILGDGRELLLRPVLPEDEPSLRESFSKLSAEEIRLRFFVPMKTMSHVMAARFTQIDYDRDMALILTTKGIPGQTELFGVVRIGADPDNEKAEYAIILRHDMTGQGLGIMMMRRIIDYAKARGIGEIYGDVLRENTTMIKLCKALGFSQHALEDEPTIIRVCLNLKGGLLRSMRNFANLIA